MVPTCGCRLRIGMSIATFSLALERGGLSKARFSRLSSAFSRPWFWRVAVVARDFRRHVGHPEDLREVQTFRLPMLDPLLRIEQIRPAIRSLNFRIPRRAISSRASSATRKK